MTLSDVNFLFPVSEREKDQSAGFDFRREWSWVSLPFQQLWRCSAMRFWKQSQDDLLSYNSTMHLKELLKVLWSCREGSRCFVSITNRTSSSRFGCD